MRWLRLLFIVWIVAGNAFAQSTAVRVWDGTDFAGVTGGALDVNATLDTTGLATEAAQDTGNASLASIDGKITACNTGAVVISSGSLTCNAGTNLNTSALATSAKQDSQLAFDAAFDSYFAGFDTYLSQIDADTSAISSSTAILDDWDESDRGKVNLIVGQAGVAGGAGNTGATVQRVVQAADVGAPLATNYGTIYQGTTALTVKRAIVSESSAGDNEVVAAVALKKIVVLSARVIASAAVNAKFRSNTTDIDGLAYLTSNSGYVLPYNPAGWYVTAAGEALNLNLSGAVPVGGIVQYVEAD